MCGFLQEELLFWDQTFADADLDFLNAVTMGEKVFESTKSIQNRLICFWRAWNIKSDESNAFSPTVHTPSVSKESYYAQN